MFSNLQKRVTAVEASPLRLVSPLLEEVEGGGGREEAKGSPHALGLHGLLHR